MALFVLLLVSIDLVILVTYTISQGVRHNLTAQRISNKENREDQFGVSLSELEWV